MTGIAGVGAAVRLNQVQVREVILADGRRLWFYEFEDEPAPAPVTRPPGDDAGPGPADPETAGGPGA
jgi:hypothetical protein